MQSLLIISQHAPFQHAAREALDLALASAAFGVPVGMLFMNDGVLQLLKGQDAAQAQQKSLAANLQALPLFGVEDLMICQHSLTERGLQVRQCQLDVRPLSGAEITSLLEHYDQVVNL
ncbi:sulfurtransferase complex subunit TusC [Halopseudomonas salegens]|uniref:tRNA 2-thiouridine synthesizing protein C n=1 Tax=Halopseudomonas salegens TaxID=1434072 RepID=A0A1H2FC08_9GAMM|nr:sulfurtransferase complex subunit TusC [Halopseudomonas salegens]SDU04508.1 tRNA 2-thiouridine synthesizing protein C [Halopseudomonas salegens]